MSKLLKLKTMQPRSRLLILLTILKLSVTGCASFQDRPLIPADSVIRIEARTLSNPLLREFIESVVGKLVWPIKIWDIDQLTLAAIYYHPDLAVARAQAETTDAATTTAAQRPNPNFTVSPTWISNLAATAAPWIAASSLSIPIETAGKRGFRIDKSKHLTDAARLRVADTAWLVRGRLRLAMLEFYAAREAEHLLQQQLVIQQMMTERLEQQGLVGEITPLEVTRGHLALNQIKLNSRAAQKRSAESKVLLATSIGIPVTALAGTEFDFSQLAQPPDLHLIPISQLRANALRTRPDILAALADYDAAQSGLQLEIANQYPNIQANPGYTWEMGENRWMLGATVLQLPVLHQNQGLIAEAETKRHELELRFEALQLRVLGDIDRVHTGLAAVFAKWQHAEMQRQLQQRNLQTARALFQAGETDRLSLLTAELENAVAERSRLDVLIETQQALNGLEDTLRYPIASTLTAPVISDSALRKSQL